ncbi:MAG TPA: GNAT family N-acetyltransferase [Stellaceae bacterium]|nr:GNAT family N-acetyltransferase [Stellaceae bacterium]
MAKNVIARRTIGGVIFEIDTAKDRLDIGLIHDFLSRCSHWARGIPRETVERAIANSHCFGLYADDRQIGFARVISDEATFAYLADVFVVAAHRKAGLGQFLVEAVLAHQPLQRLRRWHLVTRDAASLYRRCGFADLQPPPLTYLDRYNPHVYEAEKAAAD